MNIFLRLIECVILALGTYKLLEIIVKNLEKIIEKYSEN